jgi:hypothetical protein
MLIHLVACWLFMNAFILFSYLHDSELVAFIGNHPYSDYKDKGKYLDELGHFGIGRIAGLSLWAGYSSMVGFLVGIGLSLFVVIKKRWYWLNSLLIFVTMILLGVLKVPAWKYLKVVFLEPGEIFKELSVGYFLTNGLVMLALGSLLFFWNKIIAFISSDWPMMAAESVPVGSPQNE